MLFPPTLSRYLVCMHVGTSACGRANGWAGLGLEVFLDDKLATF